MNIHGLSALVTGGASGIGAGVARVLARAGAKVAILDRNAELAQATAAEIGGIAIACDVASDASVQQAVAAAQAAQGAARILVNCAGIDTARKIASRKTGAHPIGPMQRVIDVNLVGTLSCCAHASHAMLDLAPLDADGERGVLINIASVAAFNAPNGQSVYAASKAGVVGATLPMARDLARYGIRVMTIAPGLFDTPLAGTMDDAMTGQVLRQVLFPKRKGRPDEIGALVQHICENQMLNASTIRIDAGLF
ncbi:MAG: SDR family NAD(P)-dependent oxidoreductase [Porticoccaceae bacterium]|nr:SDR family NAD(P)-dependent oxidoreductase [Gammaproteobacteria bacterium]TAL07845.1 MAG: SDR family NAD(P)-dependent oxidoreductase [Porticoccaceae bacterium]